MNTRRITARKTTWQEMDFTFDREFWERVPASRRFMLVWEQSLFLWKLRGDLPDGSGRPRSVARVHRP